MKHVIIWLLGILVFAHARAQDFNSSLQQLNQRSFTADQDAPKRAYALAQTTDGMLWLGSQRGLTRFDGAKFVDYPEKSDDPLPSTDVSALMSSPDGGLWIGFRLGGLCFLRNGHLTRYAAVNGTPQGTVHRFAYDVDGSLLMGTSRGLLQLQGTETREIEPDMIRRAIDVLVDRSGTLWVATGKDVLARVRGESQFREVRKSELPDRASPRMLAQAPDGHVWMMGSGLLTRLDPLAPETAALPMRAAVAPASQLLIDSSGNFWLCDSARMPSRWAAGNVIVDTQSQARVVHAEVLSKSDALWESGALSMLEDREHNIWMSTWLGLRRFSPSRVVLAMPPCQGLGYALAADTARDLWAACDGGPFGNHGTLLQLRDGKLISERQVPKFTAAYRDSVGTLWFGGPGQVASFDGHAFVVMPLPDDLRGADVQALAKDGSGALWVSVARHGVYRFVAGQWIPNGSIGLPHEPPFVETSDDEGGVWFGYRSNRIVRVHDQTLQEFSAADGLDVGNVTAIHRAAGRIWVGGELGFSQLRGARFYPIRTASGDPIKGISGIASTKDDDLWLNAAGGIVRIGVQEVQQLIRDPNFPIQPQVFDHLDGVPGDPVQLRPTPSAMATTDGRVWFGTFGGLVWIDAAGSSRNNLAPPITLRALDSGGERYPNRGQPLHLPVHTRSVKFEYAAGSMTVPEHVRFRYKLEGLDEDWQEAGGRREAYYTNLGPGAYSFKVIGSNNDGIWNETGSSMVFTIAPAYYQTPWFYALCVVVALAVAWALYEMRLRQLRRLHEAINRSRLELAHVERLATLSTMTASITHEVSQPISGILTNANTCVRMLAADPPNVEGAKETARRTIRDADRAKEVVKRLRAMFAKRATTIERVDLNDVAQDVIAISSAELRQSGALLQTDFAESLPAIGGDRVQLQQVILNLLLNAVDAMAGIEDRPRTLRVETQLHGGDSVKLLVRDSGVGLDPRGIEKLFEAFHTTKSGGLGIGLAVSRSIIESHKGQLWATANDGPGATFGFSIPFASGFAIETDATVK